jgi:DNA (cytosine-5)-methyltransferase 1
MPDDLPAPTVQGCGIGDVNTSQYTVVRGNDDMIKQTKPPYRVPSMAEIMAAPWNGLTHVSMFSGCGGTCLGYRMAGYRTLWANDSDAHAASTYRANFPGCVFDTRDIREVTAADVLAATGLRVGELDVCEASPPCTVFSTAGKRSARWGGVAEHAGVKDVRIEDLFSVWLALVDGLRPRAFMAENVSGLVKGVSKGHFKRILAAMRALGYRTEARVVDAQWLGVPQARVRVIFVGVRDDVAVAPAFPAPLGYNYSVREAIPWIADVRLGAHGEFSEVTHDADARPSPAVCASGMPSYDYDVAVVEHGDAGDMMGKKVRSIDGPVGAVDASAAEHGREPRVEALTVMSGGSRGRPTQFVVETKAVVYNAGRGREDQDVSDRPSVTVVNAGGAASRHPRPYGAYGDVDPGGPAKTVTIASSGNDHGVASDVAATHRRKLTIAELKRICAFPDDFALAGSYARQWARLGNSVPPVMAFHLAAALRDALLAAGRRG